MAMYGAKNEAIALMNCPNVSELANLSPLITLATKGLSDVCIRVLPMPKSENAINIAAKLLLAIGINNAMNVT
jgi:hypothetical protein